MSGLESGSTEQAASPSANGLTMINGLTMTNGLTMINGFSLNSGLNSTSGLANSSAFMTSAAGRTTLTYLVKCALPPGHSITKRDQNNVSYTFVGGIGVAPEWEAGSCNQSCQEQISACLLAHVNTSGTHIHLYLDGDSPAIGWGRSTDYPYQEGSFFGNIFQSPPKAYFCNGKDFDMGLVPGRLGATQVGAPYVNPFGSGAYCKDRCAAADWPNSGDGYKTCNGFNHVVTVWRNFDPNIDYKVCARHSGQCLDVKNESTADGAQLIQYPYNSRPNQKWRITQVSPGKYNFKNMNSGKLLDIDGGGTGNGAPLWQWPANGGENQKWSFTPTADGYFKFSPGSNPSGSLDVPGGSTVRAAAVAQWTWSGAPWQQWSISPGD